MNILDSRAMVSAALAVTLAVPALVAAEQRTLTLSSSSFVDGGTFSRAQAASDERCGAGGDRSPQLSWSGAPEATRSYAVVMFDVDAKRGAGLTHWVAYGIPVTASALPEGAGADPHTYGGGMNSLGVPTYHGLCPPSDDRPHHYVVSLYALDLAPEALPAALTRDDLLVRIRGHVVAETSIIGRSGAR